MSRLDQAIKLLEPMVTDGDDGSLLVDNYTKLKEVFDILKELHSPQATLDAAQLPNTNPTVQELIDKGNARVNANTEVETLLGYAKKVEEFAGGVRKVSTLEHLTDRMNVMASAHPLDVHHKDIDDVHHFLLGLSKMPGADNLGKPGYVVVVDPRGLTDEIVDSLNGFMIAYGTGQHDCKSLRLQAALAGDRSMNVLPKWFAQTYGHVSKGGFTALCYHVLIESQVNPRFKNEPLMLSHEELEKLELRLIAGDKQAFTKALEQK